MSVLTWSKSWSSSDDGTILYGADLGNIQSDINSQVVTLAGADTISGNKTFTGQVKLRDPWIDVRAYGVTGDGSTNDTTNIATAITASAGKTLYFPTGTYSVTDLTIANHMHIIGDGKNRSIIKARTGTTSVINITASNVVIEGLEIDGNSIAKYCIYGLNIDDVTIRGCYVRRFTGSSGAGINFAATGAGQTHYNIRVLDCEIGAKVGADLQPGIALLGNWALYPGTDGQWIDCIIDNVRTYDNDGILLMAVSDTVVSNCTSLNSKDIGIDAEYCSYIRFANNHIENATNSGISFIQYVDHGIMEGNTVLNCDNGLVVGIGSTDCSLVGNQLIGGAASTASLINAQGSRIHIVGNNVIATSSAANGIGIRIGLMTNGTIIGNYIASKAGSKGLLYNTSTGGSIIGNTINAGAYNISVEGTVANPCSNNLFANNHLINPTTSSLSELDAYESGNVYANNFFKDVFGSFLATGGAIIRDNFGSLVRLAALPAADATPSIKGRDYWLTSGTTTITDFDDGITGDVITIVAEHAVTITDGTNIFLSGSIDFVMAATDTLTLICKADGLWYELSRSDNT